VIDGFYPDLEEVPGSRVILFKYTKRFHPLRQES
jgi:hypothetical protein